MTSVRRKGIWLIFQNRNADIVLGARTLHIYGNVKEPEDVGGRSGKSYLFLLTVFNNNDHGICLPGDMVLRLVKLYTSCRVRCAAYGP